jgi:hypothetical protein
MSDELMVTAVTREKCYLLIVEQPDGDRGSR